MISCDSSRERRDVYIYAKASKSPPLECWPTLDVQQLHPIQGAILRCNFNQKETPAQIDL